MGGAVVRGALAAGAFRPGQVYLAEPDAARRAEFEKAGVAGFARPADALSAAGAGAEVLLAVKPQALDDVGRDVAQAPPKGVVISILAGAKSERVRAAMGGACRVVRVMPNLPAQIGMGVSALSLGAGAGPGDETLAQTLFGAVGAVVRIDEPLMDAFTALAGSGPAYLFYLAEAMTRAGAEMGFDAATADSVVRGVLAGSAALLDKERGRSAGEWRGAVTSKGGTTAAACESLDRDGAMEAMVRAIVAARDRGRELGAR